LKLNRQQVQALSSALVDGLTKNGFVRLKVPAEQAIAAVEKGLTEDLMQEDKINDEVRGLLKAYEKEFSTGRADYKTMFDMVKKKLVRDRGLVL
jgi:uncharacterized protein